MAIIYDRVAIIGIGLIGGSLGLAARQRGLVGDVIGVARSAATRDAALAVGAADQTTDDVVAAVAGADLVYLSAPVATIPQLLEVVAPAVKLGATVTDAGSIKTEICRAGQYLLPGTFIGGHPMAGSEKAGVRAARADLFEGRTYLLTPSEEADPELLGRFEEFVRALGAVPVTTNPPEHDRLVAFSSHLPHLWASALALGLARSADGQNLIPFAGSGLRDTTRIAASDPDLWRDIFLGNRQNVLWACEQVEGALGALREALQAEQGDQLLAALQEAKEFREALGTTTPGVEAMSRGLRIAIDGPAGAGKSSVAREVARTLGYTYIDTGAMYRAVAYFALNQDLVPGRDDEKIGDLSGQLSFEFRSVGEERHLFVDGQDVEHAVRLPEIGRMSSPVSAIPLVRHNLVVAQRLMAAGGGTVMEGRDIGTVVLPDAEVKVFLTATPQERARRRVRQLREMGMEVSFDDILKEQTVRDQRDSSRSVAPLRKADDAVEIVSDGLSREEVVGRIVALVQERQNG